MLYSQNPAQCGDFYLFFEIRSSKYEGVSEVATLSVSKTEPAGSSPASLAMPRTRGTPLSEGGGAEFDSQARRHPMEESAGRGGAL